MAASMQWQRAFAVSGLIHMFIFVTTGLLINYWQIPHRTEEYVVVDVLALTAKQEITPLSGSETAPVAAPKDTAVMPERTTIDSGLAREPVRAVQTEPAVSSVAGGSHKEPVQSLGDGSGADQDVPGPSPVSARAAGTIDAGSIVEQFIAEIEKYKEYPYIARKRGQTGTVTVMVYLDGAGVLNNIQVVQPSPFSRLNEAAVGLVQKICPFPNKTGKPIVMRIPITYDLKEN